MNCPACSTNIELNDNYCRQCGGALRASRLPALIPERRLVHQPTSQVGPLVARGISALVIGKAIEWTARAALPRLASLAVRRVIQSPATRQLQKQGDVVEQPAKGVFGITRIWQEVRWYVPESTPQGKPSPWWSPFKR